MKIYSVFLVLLIFAFSCKSEQKKSSDDVQLQVAPQEKAVVEKDTLVRVPESRGDKGVDPGDQYFLIINSYTVPEFAQAAKTIYRRKGFKPAVVMRDRDGYFRMAIRSFNNFDQAVDAMHQLKEKNPEFHDLWVMSGRNQTEVFN